MTGDGYDEAKAAAERYYRRAMWIQNGLGATGVLLAGAAGVGSFVIGGPIGWAVFAVCAVGFYACLYLVWTSRWLRPYRHGSWTFYDRSERHAQLFAERYAQRIVDEVENGDDR